jgi:spore germination cell wall hydrolase CwlJ-like protein
MSLKLQRASALALVATVLSIFASSEGAVAQVLQDSSAPTIEASDPNAADIRFVSEPVVQPLPDESAMDGDRSSAAASLAELVSDMPVDEQFSDELRCLAGAIYFESRGEPLAGQLAVGDVVVNRAESGRFPSTYCGVVYQPSQFSFVRGGRMPPIDKSSSAWRNAKAIALIAHEDLWDSPAEGALFFHARYVKPRWHLTRVAQISSHVFYR